jgi:hypothetical protein
VSAAAASPNNVNEYASAVGMGECIVFSTKLMRYDRATTSATTNPKQSAWKTTA